MNPNHLQHVPYPKVQQQQAARPTPAPALRRWRFGLGGLGGVNNIEVSLRIRARSCCANEIS